MKPSLDQSSISFAKIEYPVGIGGVGTLNIRGKGCALDKALTAIGMKGFF